MNWIVAADIVAMAAFGAALVCTARLPARHPGVGSPVKFTLLMLVTLLFFVCVSNVLEHAGVTAFWDTYEDYAEVLFVPLTTWALFSRADAERIEASRRAEQAVRAEHELLTSIVDTSPAGILVADSDGVVSFANDVAEQMLARRLPGQLELGAIVRDAPTPRMREVLGEGAGLVYIAARSTPLSATEDATRRAVVVLTDVTERVRNDAEVEEYRYGLERAIDRRTAELLEANRQLQTASDAKQRFLAKMSHELKTPLNSIIGFSDVMLKGLSGPLTPEQETQLGMVRNSGSQLLDLVNDVLEISRLEAGYSPVSVSAVDVSTRMRELTASMEALATTHEVSLACEGAPGAVVSTDADKLDQIVRNLLSNAIKFTDPGGHVTITVSGDRDSVFVVVADDGIGIAEEDRGRIFEAFQQVETPDRVRPEGTGLGLVICRELCDTLGCTLVLESAPGEGSAFTVALPRQFPGHLVIL